MTARLRVVSAGPLVTFQDGGRTGNMRFGVPASGPMDRLAHATANLAIGNPADATAIEVSRGGLVVEVLSGPVTFGVAGGSFDVDRGGVATSGWGVHTLRTGEQIGLRAGAWGNWTYLALAGDLDVPSWLGHTATHSLSGFGGGVVSANREFDVLSPRDEHDRDGEIPVPDFARLAGKVRVVVGPQERHFAPESVAALTASAFRLTDAYDRMGVRLDGPMLHVEQALSIPSEAVVRGSIQVAGDGVATVLLADHQTTGGYPKIATVISCDIDRFAQVRPGDSVEFEAVDPAEAVEAARDHGRRSAEHFTQVASEGRTLSHRLRRENLIGGAAAPDHG